MGATNSSIILNVNLPKQTFTPGESINGTFSFDFSKGIKKKIKLKNPEVIISFSTIESTHKHPEGLKTTLVSTTISIPELSKINENPQMLIPFQTQIPTNAKPSFEFFRAKMYASFRTFLKIEIPIIKAEGTIFIIIKKLPNLLNTPLDLVDHTKKKGLFSLDNIAMNLKCHTNSFPIKSQNIFYFSADFSKTKYNLKSVEYTLKREIKFFNENKVSEKIIDELQQKKIKGNMEKQKTVNFVVDFIDPQEIYKKYSMDKLYMIEGLKPNDVINLLPNIKTYLFECEYYIKIKAITDTPIISALNSPSMSISLDVFQADNCNMNFNVRQSFLYQQLLIQQSNIRPIIDSSIKQPFIQSAEEQLNQPENGGLFDNSQENEELDMPTLEEIDNNQIISV